VRDEPCVNHDSKTDDDKTDNNKTDDNDCPAVPVGLVWLVHLDCDLRPGLYPPRPAVRRRRPALQRRQLPLRAAERELRGDPEQKHSGLLHVVVVSMVALDNNLWLRVQTHHAAVHMW
jgi:hypothetical protein